MPNTPNRSYTYPGPNDAPNGPAQLQELATDIDTDVQAIAVDVAARQKRIATSIVTADSSSVTAESGAQSVAAALIAGRTYKVTWTCAVGGSVNGDTAFVRIRQDTTAGAQLQIVRVHLPATGGTGTRYPASVEAEYTPAANETKTFWGTVARASGTGTVQARADPTFPIHMYVDYVRG